MNFENVGGVLKEIPSYHALQAQKEVEAKAKAAEDRKAKQNRINNVDSGNESNQINNNSSPHHTCQRAAQRVCFSWFGCYHSARQAQ